MEPKKQCRFLMAVVFCISTSSASVSHNFKGCTQFFVNNYQPKGFPATPGHDDIVQICQNHNGELPNVFATRYDIKNKIPTYSAYIMDHVTRFGRPHGWNIEKDLNNSDQAHNQAYKYNDLDRGHLCPSHYIKYVNRAATFLLTNAVPQHSKFNQGVWNKAEIAAQKLIMTYCREGIAYFITGAVPGNETMKTSRKHKRDEIITTRVTIPSSLYTAMCCKFPDGHSFSFGYFGENVIKNQSIKVMDVLSLGSQIQRDYNANGLQAKQIDFFNTNCDYINKTYVNKLKFMLGKETKKKHKKRHFKSRYN